MVAVIDSVVVVIVVDVVAVFVLVIDVVVVVHVIIFVITVAAMNFLACSMGSSILFLAFYGISSICTQSVSCPLSQC